MNNATRASPASLQTQPTIKALALLRHSGSALLHVQQLRVSPMEPYNHSHTTFRGDLRMLNGYGGAPLREADWILLPRRHASAAAAGLGCLDVHLLEEFFRELSFVDIFTFFTSSCSIRSSLENVKGVVHVTNASRPKAPLGLLFSVLVAMRHAMSDVIEYRSFHGRPLADEISELFGG